MTGKQTKGLQARTAECAIVGILIVAICLRASLEKSGALLSVLHGGTLFGLFVIVSSVLRQLHPWAGRAFFSLTVIVLAFEAAIQFMTGMHLNWFVLSLLLQDNSSAQVGVPFSLVAGGIIVALVVLIGFSTRLEKRRFSAPVVKTLVIVSAVFGATQFRYAYAYFDGAAEILQARRTLPFFWAPHPYQSNKLLGIVLGPRAVNPFSHSDIEVAKSAFEPPSSSAENRQITLDPATAPNILLIVSDSLRSKDIRADRSLMPNLFSAATEGYLSLDHYSVSNCTHFSMYTLLTGRLATSYGSSRRRGAPTGLFPSLALAGYRLSTAESSALDWYDLSEILLPAETERWIAETEDTIENDAAITDKTIIEIGTWPTLEVPTLHMAFYHGTHYPYSESLNTPGATNLDRYKQSIQLFDENLGKILRSLKAQDTGRKTLVIVTSDHGEEFLSEGRVGHASRLSDEQVKVPFLMLGAVDDTSALRSHADVFGFLLDAVDTGPTQPSNERPIVLANCDYDFPTGFALIDGKARYNFLYDEGYLVPGTGSDGSKNPPRQMDAARTLLTLIKSDP